MADVIKLLPDSISNQIAAGEVVLRPASVVKELLENSVDAGSENIQLIVKDAGRQLIQIVDDGCGMSTTDARMCFERHATSKIKRFEDIQNVMTMGFRGEALASIASVAMLEMRTRKHADELGTCIVVEGSTVTKHEPCQGAPGTSIAVKNLFYNTPARRNFLKSNNAEMRHIVDEFRHVALAHPEIAFTMAVNGAELYRLDRGNLRKRVAQTFGKGTNEKLVPVDETGGLMEISGFVGKPDQARKTRGEQFFFVNKRFIKSNYLNHAVYKAYTDLIPPNTFPLFVIFIDVDPAYTDVNVHPTKQEIKFEDERNVYAYVNSAVRHALGKFSVTPTIDFEHAGAMKEMGVKPIVSTTSPKAKTMTPIKKLESVRSQVAPQWKELYKAAKHTPAETITLPSASPEAPIPGEEPEPLQLHNKYILCPLQSGFVLIDQQAAHERVRFEQYQKRFDAQKSFSQRQLFPKTIHLETAEAELLRTIADSVNSLGFDLQEFGENDFVVHALPVEIDAGDEQSLIENLLEQYKENRHALHLEVHESLARSLATSSAIKSGRKLSSVEMRTLIDELFACAKPETAPNGRRTFATFTLDELEKRFAR